MVPDIFLPPEDVTPMNDQAAEEEVTHRSEKPHALQPSPRNRLKMARELHASSQREGQGKQCRANSGPHSCNFAKIKAKGISSRGMGRCQNKVGVDLLQEVHPGEKIGSR